MKNVGRGCNPARCVELFNEVRDMGKNKTVELANLNVSGLLTLECPFCDYIIKQAKLYKFNKCDMCDSEMQALPPTRSKTKCEVGRWKSRIT